MKPKVKATRPEPELENQCFRRRGGPSVRYAGLFLRRLDAGEFRGFGYVRVTDPEGHFKETYFRQDNTYKGRPEKEVVYDRYERKYQETIYDWLSMVPVAPGTDEPIQGVRFPFLKTKTTTAYNPQDETDFKSTSVVYTYYTHGSVKFIREYGFDGTTLTKKTRINYTDPNIDKWIVGKPSSLTIYNGENSEDRVAKTYYYYDNNSLSTDMPMIFSRGRACGRQE